jgi:hypothetical protein
MYTLTCYVDEEDYAMQQPDPMIPLRARIPQVSPQEVAQRRAATPRQFMVLPRTPMPQQKGQEEIRYSSPGIPVTPPYSIPGYFAKGEEEGNEPGLAETLMGCGMLLLMGLVVVAVLYYLMI